MTRPSPSAVLELEAIGKSYAAPVLSQISLVFHGGEVHALMGANGAGKSTLARIASGLIPPDRGAMRLEGLPYRPAVRAQAAAQGVQIVQQELNVIGTLSVAENLFLDRLPSRGGWIARAQLRRDARSALAAVGLDSVDPDEPAGRLGIGQQQLLEIAAALARPCRLLILDEPTATLTDPQALTLFHHIDRLRRNGVAIVYISHRMEEIQRIADRTSVLRDGVLVATRPTRELPMDELVALMVGTELSHSDVTTRRKRGPVALRVEHLTRGERVRDISLTLHEGEILGVSGLVGAGRTELLRAIYGADAPESGQLYLGDDPRPRRFDHPRQAVAAGLGLVPEDRKSQGLLLACPSRVNLSLSGLDIYTGPLGWLDRKAEERAAIAAARAVQLRCRSIEQTAQQLSGGNQQKLLLGRWLLREPSVLLVDEPTRGIDIAAKQVIYQLLDDLAARGKALLVVSSDLDELIAICDRIAVISAGRLTGIFNRSDWTKQALLEAAFRNHLTRVRREEPGVSA